MASRVIGDLLIIFQNRSQTCHSVAPFQLIEYPFLGVSNAGTRRGLSKPQIHIHDITVRLCTELSNCFYEYSRFRKPYFGSRPRTYTDSLHRKVPLTRKAASFRDRKSAATEVRRCTETKVVEPHKICDKACRISGAQPPLASNHWRSCSNRPLDLRIELSRKLTRAQRTDQRLAKTLVSRYG